MITLFLFIDTSLVHPRFTAIVWMVEVYDFPISEMLMRVINSH